MFQDSTAAGIRQTLKINSSVSIIDEAEPDERDNSNKMRQILEMIRRCSTGRHVSVVRGTVNGEAVDFNTRSIFCLASIQDTLQKASDKSRFFVMELQKISRPEEFRAMQEAFSKIDPVALYFYVYEHSKEIIERIKQVKDILITTLEPRQADQIAPMLAGWMLLSGETVVTDVIEALATYVEDTDIDESELCLESILNTIIDNQTGETVARAIQVTRKDYTPPKLASYGIEYSDSTLFIQTGNKELKKLMEREYPLFSKIIRRHKDVISERVTKRINGIPTKGVLIKFERNV